MLDEKWHYFQIEANWKLDGKGLWQTTKIDSPFVSIGVLHLVVMLGKIESRIVES